MFTKRKTCLTSGIVVASIPKSSILSVRTCALAEHISFVPHGHGATLSLALALYSEILRGPESAWHLYLQSLPPATVPIARLWGDPHAFPDDTDAREAARWIHGTEIQRELQDEDGCPLVDEIRAFYKSDVQPLLDSAGLSASLQGFLRAYSLVCSRAFLVDAYHGLSMVPVADAFNHTHENHVQMASDFHVCPICGSLHECPHDRDDNLPPPSLDTPPARTQNSTDSDTVDMVTVRPIPPHSEVFNTYGADLGNASLLARYGFALDAASDTDIVTFGWSGSGILVDSDEDMVAFRVVHREALRATRDIIRGSTLLFAPHEDERETRWLMINSDGQVSLGLFIWAVWSALMEGPQTGMEGLPDPDLSVALLQLLPRAAKALRQIEAAREEEGDVHELEIADDLVRTAWTLTRACQLLEGAAEALASLCRTRASGMGKKGYRGASAAILTKLLDNLPAVQSKTKLALEYLLAERALLEACAVGWEDIRDQLSGESIGGDESDMEL
ncbi:SET domain-containing protein [Cubamyces sp. BRFM 1775]|nr:SET domain-containing protein [Cubamyces sp. BRFM 1775]